jgi:hypothetical protein
MRMPMRGLPIYCLIALAVLCLGAGDEEDPQFLRPIEQGVADVTPLSESLRMLELNLQEPIGFADVYHVPGRPDWLMRVSGGLFAVFPQSVYSSTEAGVMPVIPNNTVFYIGRASLANVPMGPLDRPEWEKDARAMRFEPRVDIRLDDTLLLAEDLAIEESRPLVERPSNVTGTEAMVQSQTATPRGAVGLDRAEFPKGTVMHRSTPRWKRFDAGAEQQLAPGTIEGDPEYRAERLRTLMRRAARNEAERHSAGS